MVVIGGQMSDTTLKNKAWINEKETDSFLGKKEIKKLVSWDLLRKDLKPTAYEKRYVCVAAVVPACHLPLLNKWCAAGFCRATLRLSHGGLLRPISCRERAVRGRSRAVQFWAAQLNNELKAITRLCEAERSTVGRKRGGREGERWWGYTVRLWLWGMNLFTPAYCSVSKLTHHTTSDVQVFFFLLCRDWNVCLWGGVFFLFFHCGGVT